MIQLFELLEQFMMVHPDDRNGEKADDPADELWEQFEERVGQRTDGSMVLNVRHFYFQDKQCDDDCEDPVGKGFDPGFTENRFHNGFDFFAKLDPCAIFANIFTNKVDTNILVSELQINIIEHVGISFQQ